MIEKVDYSKYLSIDNGQGLLLNPNDVYVLKHYGIDYMKCSNMSDLIFIIGVYVDNHYNEELDELEEVLDHLLEVHYYTQVNK